MSETQATGTKDRLLAEFNAIVSETERLLKGSKAGSAQGDDAPVSGLDSKLDENLKAARERLEALEDTVLSRAQAAFKATDAYVRANPWPAVGIAAGIGLLIGLLLRRR
jgi:ElaB/YqjD/DUF883 family membrane-anchored ribosome-binding protein